MNYLPTLLSICATLLSGIIGWLVKSAFADRDRRISELEDDVSLLRAAISIHTAEIRVLEKSTDMQLKAVDRLIDKVDELGKEIG